MAINDEQELTLIFAEFWNAAFTPASGHQSTPASKDYLLVYQVYVERRCHELDANYLRPACDILGIEGTTADPQNRTARHLKFLILFIESMGSPIYSVTLDNFVDGLYRARMGVLIDADRNTLHRACFACFGLLSLFWHADPANTSRQELAMSIPTANPRSDYVTLSNQPDSCWQPIRDYFKVLYPYLPHLTSSYSKLVTDQAQSSESIPNPSLEIQSSSISYRALRKVARVSIKWTDSILMHLIFDKSMRQIFVFRLPTLCVLSCQSNRETVYDRILTEGYMENHPYGGKSPAYLMDKELKREILLSYRVIFGQHRWSRTLFLDEFERSDILEQDPLLKTLCATPLKTLNRQLPGNVWPESCRDYVNVVDGMLQELDVYDTSTDFPLLGDRLMKLQQFSLRQSPSKFKDVWRDFRNPLQWYTFWAVIIFGLVSIGLSFLQLLLSIAQLVVGVKQLAPRSS